MNYVIVEKAWHFPSYFFHRRFQAKGNSQASQSQVVLFRPLTLTKFPLDGFLETITQILNIDPSASFEVFVKVKDDWRLLPLELNQTQPLEPFLKALQLRDLALDAFGVDLSHKVKGYLAHYYQGWQRQQELILASPRVRKAMSDMVKEGARVDQCHRRALKYSNEIISRRNFLSPRLFWWLTEAIYRFAFREVRFLEKPGWRLKNLQKKYQLIYLPTHRSHCDFLILPNVLFKAGIESPFVATSTHLNFFPLNRLLHQTCGSFIRRKKMNPLYNHILGEFYQRLSLGGHSQLLFVEGTRSKNGKTLSPKSGLVSQIIQSYWQVRERVKPLAFVPINISYNYLHEGDFMVPKLLDTMSDEQKRHSAFEQIMTDFEALEQAPIWSRILRTLRWTWQVSRHGVFTARMGQPIVVDKSVIMEPDAASDDFERDRHGIPGNAIRKIARKVVDQTVVSLNEEAPVTLESLAITALWWEANGTSSAETSQTTAKPHDKLLKTLQWMCKYLNQHPSLPDVAYQSLTLEELESFSFLNQDRRRRSVEGVGIVRGQQQVFLTPVDQLRSSFLKNNVAHHFAVAVFILQAGSFRESVLENNFQKDFTNLNGEHHLLYNPSPVTVKKLLFQSLETLVKMGSVSEKDGVYEVASDLPVSF